MSRKNKQKRIVIRIVVPILAAVLLLMGACLFYLESYYRADTAAIEAFPVSRTAVEITLESGDTVFDPGGARVGLIFYPGGKVEESAYTPLLRELAADGFLCILCRMPFRLAVLDVHAADAAREAYPNIEHWYVGGHSLGGTIAAFELEGHPGTYDGLILLGAYATKDLSEEPIRALSIYGSEDRVLDREKYEKNRKNLPDETVETMIAGGCHAFFGMYGSQRGDGEPTISNEEQIRVTAETIRQWMETNGGAYAEDP